MYLFPQSIIPSWSSLFENSVKLQILALIAPRRRPWNHQLPTMRLGHCEELLGLFFRVFIVEGTNDESCQIKGGKAPTFMPLRRCKIWESSQSGTFESIGQRLKRSANRKRHSGLEGSEPLVICSRGWNRNSCPTPIRA